ncbi:MAG: OmpA family protein [Rickettsiales bacterium]|jgi:outer membrane protein OmpA-like peptidoglycan-associated protein|nr:OmpA family protein [Rickettsiales bacterium]
MKFILYSFLFFLCACAKYETPPRAEWGTVLSGANFTDMTPEMQVATRPVYLGAGGKIFSGDARARAVILENELYDALRVSGVSVQRVGTEVIVLIVRDAFMYTDAAEISENGERTLGAVAKILKKYNDTMIEISGYADAMRDKTAAGLMTTDMAQRAGIFLVKNSVAAQRLFIVGRGSDKPIAGQEIIGRKMNRRIELRIAPVVANAPKSMPAEQKVAQTASINDYRNPQQ